MRINSMSISTIANSRTMFKGSHTDTDLSILIRPNTTKTVIFFIKPITCNPHRFSNTTNTMIPFRTVMCYIYFFETLMIKAFRAFCFMTAIYTSLARSTAYNTYIRIIVNASIDTDTYTLIQAVFLPIRQILCRLVGYVTSSRHPRSRTIGSKMTVITYTIVTYQFRTSFSVCIERTRNKILQHNRR